MSTDSGQVTRQRRRRGLAATVWAGTVACIIGSCGTAGADPGQPPQTPALLDDGQGCGPWVSPNIGNPLGVLVGQAVHQAMCEATRQQPPTPPGQPHAPTGDAP